ncbi:MAG: hypothetical protein M3Q60_19305 [Actinomycetota bacterium]|nr:hypothetical protein [Actinomycetota bacterium]
MRDLERIRYVAANYGRLQGLRKLPVGLFFLLWVAALVSTLVWTRTLEDTVVPAGYVYAVLCLVVMIFVGSVLLYDRIGVYYERRYGSVERFSRVPARRKALYAAIVLAVVLGSSFGLLVLGVAMMVAHRPERRFQTHYLAMAALLVGYGLFHMVGLVVSVTLSPDLLDAMLVLHKWGRLITLPVLGLYFLVGGVLDHLLLTGTMKALPEEEEQDGGAAV